MPIVTSSRQLTAPDVPYKYITNGVVVDKGTQANLVGSQTTTSFRTGKGLQTRDDEYESLSGEGMRRQIQKEYQLRYDTGNAFNTFKTVTENLVDYGVLYRRINATNVREAVVPITIVDVGTPPAFASYLPSGSTMDSDGQRGIALATPTAPEAGLAAFIGELRERKPELIGAALYKNLHRYDNLRRIKGARGFHLAERHDRFAPRDLGAEHLNVQFGLKPFIADIQTMAQAVLHTEKLLRQYRRDSGKTIHRRRHLRDATTTNRWLTSASATRGIPKRNGVDPTADWWLSSGSVSGIDVIRTQAWFSGAFEYHLSEAHSFIGKMESYAQQANHLLGTNITLDTVWQLTPWSWLIDWFSDSSSFVKNISNLSTDSMVLRYSYVMHRVDVTRYLIATGAKLQAGAIAPTSYGKVTYYTSKNRRRGTPYGFGINVGSLSPRRWAILAALGLTKAPNSLHLRS